MSNSNFKDVKLNYYYERYIYNLQSTPENKQSLYKNIYKKAVVDLGYFLGRGAKMCHKNVVINNGNFFLQFSVIVIILIDHRVEYL